MQLKVPDFFLSHYLSLSDARSLMKRAFIFSFHGDILGKTAVLKPAMANQTFSTDATKH